MHWPTLIQGARYKALHLDLERRVYALLLRVVARQAINVHQQERQSQ